MTREELHKKLEKGWLLLDDATGSNLLKMGMPKGSRAELFALEHPEVVENLQRQYVEAGSEILYAPTFQAQPLNLEKANLGAQTEKINAKLVALSRKAAQGMALVAGNLTTLAGDMESWDEENFDKMVSLYRRQIRGLLDGGADLLAAETLLYPVEGEAIQAAAELEGAKCVMYSFTMQPDGALFSGRDAGSVLRELEEAGAAAVGFNCVAASEHLPGLVSRLRRQVKGPFLAKPNAGSPIIGGDGLVHYPMGAAEFAAILNRCAQMGAKLLGGCCGTDPDYLQRLRRCLDGCSQNCKLT